VTARVGIVAGVLAGVAALAIAGYRAMIHLKPNVPRASLDNPARDDIAALGERLMAHVRVLGSDIGERHLGRPQALRAAAEYIQGAWAAQGFAVAEESFLVGGGPCANLVAGLTGSARPERIVVVGAHYDSVPGSPGANDNATGVALLLELSRSLRRAAPARTLRFVAFVNEEPPYFMTEAMGSHVHARLARQRGDAIVAMISLETLGAYSSAPGSQRYPFPFGAFYPHAGNFLGVVANLASRGLAVEFLRHFLQSSDFPVEGLAAPALVPGVAWSDHWSFWQAGYPALMLTDTAPFRYPHYHTAADLPDRINATEFARAGHGIIEAVRRLAGAP
jgi:peptidase M28-like protein